MDVKEFETLIKNTIEVMKENAAELDEELDDGLRNVRDVVTYEEAGMVTYPDGIVVRMRDHTEFRLTISKVSR